MHRLLLFIALSAVAVAQAQDAAQLLGAKLESATLEERARLLEQEGPNGNPASRLQSIRKS